MCAGKTIHALCQDHQPQEEQAIEVYPTVPQLHPSTLPLAVTTAQH